MLIELFLVLILFVCLVEFIEYSMQSLVVHATTGKSLIFGDSYFSAIYSSIFGTVSNSRKGTIAHNKYGNIYAKLNFFKYTVSVRSVESAKTILSDSKTYIKPLTTVLGSINEGASKLMNPNNVVFVNGEEWIRQRKSVNPGFYDLSIYTPKFIEKSKKTLEILKKNPIVPDIHDLLQKMTL